MLIAFTGRLGSGKDTAARCLIERHGRQRFAFADVLKELAAASGLAEREELGWTGTDWSGPKSEWGRKVLQGLGHGARQVLGHDVWVDGLARAMTLSGLPPHKVAVVDCRYPNEVDWVHKQGGIVLRIARPGVDRSSTEHHHPTETQIDALDVDFEIVNDGTVQDLWRKVETTAGTAHLLSRQVA